MCSFSYWLQKIADWEDQRIRWLLTNDLDFSEYRETLQWPTVPREIIKLEDGKLTSEMAHWGLVPSWAKDTKSGRNCFNARAETVSEKPTFRAAFKQRRCLIPSVAYGEWADLIEDRKQPVKFKVDGGKPHAYAGLWETWGDPAAPYLSCTMITCEPNELAGQVHTRMPVILREEDYQAWLAPTQTPKDLLPLLIPFESERMSMEFTTLPPRKKESKVGNGVLEF